MDNEKSGLPTPTGSEAEIEEDWVGKKPLVKSVDEMVTRSAVGQLAIGVEKVTRRAANKALPGKLYGAQMDKVTGQGTDAGAAPMGIPTQHPEITTPLSRSFRPPAPKTGK